MTTNNLFDGVFLAPYIPNASNPLNLKLTTQWCSSAQGSKVSDFPGSQQLLKLNPIQMPIQLQSSLSTLPPGPLPPGPLAPILGPLELLKTLSPEKIVPKKEEKYLPPGKPLLYPPTSKFPSYYYNSKHWAGLLAPIEKSRQPENQSSTDLTLSLHDRMLPPEASQGQSKRISQKLAFQLEIRRAKQKEEIVRGRLIQGLPPGTFKDAYDHHYRSEMHHDPILKKLLPQLNIFNPRKSKLMPQKVRERTQSAFQLFSYWRRVEDPEGEESRIEEWKRMSPAQMEPWFLREEMVFQELKTQLELGFVTISYYEKLARRRIQKEREMKSCQKEKTVQNQTKDSNEPTVTMFPLSIDTFHKICFSDASRNL